MYIINPFLINLIDNNCVIQTGTSTVVITNQRLIGFLSEIEIQKIKSYTDQELEVEFGENKDLFLSFLLENEILIKKEKPFFIFNKVWILSNNNVFPNLFHKFAKNVMPGIHVLQQDSDFSNVKSDDLCIVFFNPFNLKNYIRIVDTLKEKGVIIKTVFFYNHSIYISNYYKKTWGNPCPKCFFYSLETQLRGTINSNNINFQTIIDMIYEENALFNIEAKLEPIDYLKPLEILLFDIRYDSNPNVFINKAYEINIKNGTINQDFSYHWELCDCYE